MSIARPVAALLLLMSMAACSTDAQGTNNPPPSAPAGGLFTDGPVAGCSDAIDHEAKPPGDYQVAAGVVAVPAKDKVLTAEPNASGEGPTRLFAKWGLLVRAGVTVKVSVAEGWTERVRLGWGAGSAEPATTIEVISCPATNGEGAWSVFAGGTWVSETDCVPILVDTGEKQATVELSVGAPCARPGG